ncbi:uncharacterized protein [Dendropsophus ebraccatus]|uniref:uncharacterized protein n=1 Tax=Dendropsophus ebraccatus TaxID=150705 RepID=UPI0038312E79
MPSCLVTHCISKTGRKGQSEQIILHPFPKDISRIKVWLQQTGQIYTDLNALAQKILDENKQNKYRLCSCHFTLDSYIFNKHGRSLKVDAIPSIFPIVKEGEYIIAENLKKNRVKRVRKGLDASGSATSMNERYPDLALLDKNRQNQYGLCPCHFNLDPYIFSSHATALEVDAVPSIYPIVKEEKCIMEENRMKNCVDQLKRPYDTAAPTTSTNGRLIAQEEEALQGVQLTKIGFCSTGTQTDSTLSNSVVFIQKKGSKKGSGVQERPFTLDAAVTASLDLISKLKHEMDSLLHEVPIRFDDVAVYFTAEEWETMGMLERLLYMDVMLENYYNLFSLGFIYEKPEIISRMETGLDLCHTAGFAYEKPKTTSTMEKSHKAGFAYEKPEIISGMKKGQDRCPTANLQPITVKQEPEADVSTRYWTVESSMCGEQELLLQEQMCNGAEQPIYHSEDSRRQEPVDQTFYNGNGLSQGKTWTGSELMADCESQLSERQYICTDCGKCFSRTSNLARHRRIHEVNRSYICGKCGILIDSTLLLIHRKMYNGRKPYTCSFCGSYVVCTL